ncbi:DUF4260 family protein [Micromonospora sp. DT41]|uniref:DUF4260 family protein n=1 Tax=Micromonospora sp. DT41 TaxID=3393437 RepID=UPI003CEAE777
MAPVGRRCAGTDRGVCAPRPGHTAPRRRGRASPGGGPRARVRRGAVAVAAAGFGRRIGWLGVLALAWVFHIAVDRGLGYGLKTAEGFEHTPPRLDRQGQRA